ICAAKARSRSNGWTSASMARTSKNFSIDWRMSSRTSSDLRFLSRAEACGEPSHFMYNEVASNRRQSCTEAFMSRVAVLFFVTMFAGLTGSLDGVKPGTKEKIDVTIVKKDALDKVIRAQRGKVTVVYFWASYDVFSRELFQDVLKFQ